MRNPFAPRWTDLELATMITGYCAAGGLLTWHKVAQDLSIILGAPTEDLGRDMDIAANFGVAGLALGSLGIREMFWVGRHRRVAKLIPQAFRAPPSDDGLRPLVDSYRHYYEGGRADGRKGRDTILRIAELFIDYIDSCYEADDTTRALRSPAARGVIERALIELTENWNLELAAHGLAHARELELQDAQTSPEGNAETPDEA